MLRSIVIPTIKVGSTLGLSFHVDSCVVCKGLCSFFKNIFSFFKVLV